MQALNHLGSKYNKRSLFDLTKKKHLKINRQNVEIFTQKNEFCVC